MNVLLKLRMKLRYILSIFVSLQYTLSVLVYMLVDNVSLLIASYEFFNDLCRGLYSPSPHSSGLTDIIAIINGIVGSFIIFLSLSNLIYSIIRLIIANTQFLNNIFIQITDKLPSWQIGYAISISLSITITILFKYIENTTWLDAMYFVVVTIATVGFGDVKPNYTSTKFLTIVLIFNGIMFLGITSQILIDRIINLQLHSHTNLPHKPINYTNHIIVAGFGSKGKSIANLLRDRQFPVVIVDQDENRIRLAKHEGFKTIYGSVTRSSILYLLNLKKAIAIFLILSDDNVAIQSAILTRSIAPDIEIYAELQQVSTHKIARYAGITKPILFSHFLTNFIQSYFISSDTIPLYPIRDLKTLEASVDLIELTKEALDREIYSKYVIIGLVKENINELTLLYNPKLLDNLQLPPYDFDNIDDNSKIVIAVNKEELISKVKPEIHTSILEKRNRLIIAGFPQYAKTLVERIEIPDNEIIVFIDKKQTPDHLQKFLEASEYITYDWSLENSFLLIEEIIRDGDIVICLFEDITSSLLVTAGLKQLNKKYHLIQLVPYEHDIEPIITLGADNVITPVQIISDAFLSQFFKSLSIPPSYVFSNYHIFEHLVEVNDYFYMKKVEYLIEFGYEVLYIRKSDDEFFREAIMNDRIEENDRLIIAKQIT